MCVSACVGSEVWLRIVLLCASVLFLLLYLFWHGVLLTFLLMSVRACVGSVFCLRIVFIRASFFLFSSFCRGRGGADYVAACVCACMYGQCVLPMDCFASR